MKSWSEIRREIPSESLTRMDARLYEKLASMPPLRLRWRRRIESTLAVGFVFLALYLRVFVFLKISPGALLVYLCFGCGVLLAEDARRVGQRIKAGRVSS